ncbi:MAG: iron-sulfur protein [Spirochaetales bacterium]|nr:iron-sulfur protein [Spirochaetales bacterium]
MLTKEGIIDRVKSQGFQEVRIFNRKNLKDFRQEGAFLERLKPYLPESNDSPWSAIVCALSCYIPDEKTEGIPGGEPSGSIAPFAQRNYYTEAVDRLKKIFRQIQYDLKLTKKNRWIFCNSRIPEKSMAAACGLGFYGRNSLIISKELGSLFVIAGLVLPLELEPDYPVQPIEGFDGCRDCSACMNACPTRAITHPGVIDPDLCLQSLSTRLSVLPDEIKRKWGRLLYGCQICQDVCPYNRHLTQSTENVRGQTGPEVPLKKILAMNESGVKAFFRGTALDRNWIPPAAILRNALLAAAGSRDGSLVPYIETCLKGTNPVLKDAAEWAKAKILSG